MDGVEACLGLQYHRPAPVSLPLLGKIMAGVTSSAHSEQDIGETLNVFQDTIRTMVREKIIARSGGSGGIPAAD